MRLPLPERSSIQASNRLRLIRHCRPPYFIHGHMHLNYRLDARRTSLLDDTQVVNAYGHYLFEIDTTPGR